MSDPNLTAATDEPIKRRQLVERDPLAACVHCGFCLDVCPTYSLTGDENNSPRGRLRLWREEAGGRLPANEWTDFYTSECVGCLACEPACPANVPYGELLERTRHQHVAEARFRPKLLLRLASLGVARPKLLNWLMLPARLLRKHHWLRHPMLFQGQPSVTESTAAYTERLLALHRPTGPRVAFLTGCLMESLFREINFATVRVLIENNVQVVIAPEQSCCGAFQEHLGLAGVEQLRDRNRGAFQNLEVEAVVSNSAGCGLALHKTLGDRVPVLDVVTLLGKLDLVRRSRGSDAARVYVDLPCHLIHGQRVDGIPTSVLDASGYRWELAPLARDCCGSGGIYNVQKPENARAILERKVEFLHTAEGEPVIVATSNHVCMMQWNSARGQLVKRPFQVRHIVQLLDPGPVFCDSKVER